MNTIEMISNTVRTGSMFKSTTFSLIVAYDSALGLCYVTDAKVYKDTVVCNDAFMRSDWEPYVEPVDWSKVPVDTKVVVKSCLGFECAHFAGIKSGKPTVWDCGKTSWTASEDEYSWYSGMKLAEE